jgi:hypothetical protein
MKKSMSFRMLSTVAKRIKEENNKTSKIFDCGHASEVGS